jgi:hypothetical protein
MSRKPTPKRTRPRTKEVLRLPDLDQAKASVLNSTVRFADKPQSEKTLTLQRQVTEMVIVSAATEQARKNHHMNHTNDRNVIIDDVSIPSHSVGHQVT